MNLTSIIIPSFNGLTFLQDCIYSIKRFTDTPYEIIVVDNGSYDGTLGFCRQEEVIFISVSENLGFPAACNMGLTVACGNQLLLLNNDILVSRNWLSNMLACLNSQDDIGIVGPTTNYASGKQQIGMPFTSLDEMSELLNKPNTHKWQQVERIVGLCFLFTRRLMDQIGLFDERFSPGHYEDDDYCYRARMAGYRLMIAGDVFVYHHGSASFAQQGEERLKQLIAKNHQKFVDKWGVDPKSFI